MGLLEVLAFTASVWGQQFCWGTHCDPSGINPDQPPGYQNPYPGHPGHGGYPHPGYDDPSDPHDPGHGGYPDPGGIIDDEPPYPGHPGQGRFEQVRIGARGFYRPGDKLFLRHELDWVGVKSQFYNLEYAEIIVAGQGPIALVMTDVVVDQKGILREGEPIGRGLYRVRLLANPRDGKTQSGFWQIHFVGGARASYEVKSIVLGISRKREGRPQPPQRPPHPPVRERTFYNPTCGSGQSCACFGRTGQADNQNADLFCRSQGFHMSVFHRLLTRESYQGEVICSVNGNCFSSRNPRNLVCTEITCQ